MSPFISKRANLSKPLGEGQSFRSRSLTGTGGDKQRRTKSAKTSGEITEQTVDKDRWWLPYKICIPASTFSLLYVPSFSSSHVSSLYLRNRPSSIPRAISHWHRATVTPALCIGVPDAIYFALWTTRVKFGKIPLASVWMKNALNP